MQLNNIDQIISTKLLDLKTNPKLYRIIITNILYSPYRPDFLGALYITYKEFRYS